MHARMFSKMFRIAFKSHLSRNVDLQIVCVSSESDCSGAAFDHRVAAGATISTVCSPCQAGTYSSGAGWIPLLMGRGICADEMHPLLCAYGCSEAWKGCRYNTSCAKSDSAFCGHTWTRACLRALRGLRVSITRDRMRSCGCKCS